MHLRQRGFTLVEIAIVLAIIGLLVGGTFKGQELIRSARVRDLIAQQDSIKAAYLGFQDRFRAVPGDFASAGSTLRCPAGAGCLNGNGNGAIEEHTVPVGAGGSPSEVHEELLAWMHLASAGFLTGSFAMHAGESVATDTNNPEIRSTSFCTLPTTRTTPARVRRSADTI